MKLGRKLNLKDAIAHSSSAIDYFVLCQGTDHRAYEALRILQSHGIIVKHLIIFNFISREETLLTEEVRRYHNVPQFAQKESKIHLENIRDFGVFISNFKEAVGSLKGDENIFIDISCFLKPHFFIIIKSLKYNLNEALNIVYTEPATYKFRENLYDQFEYSKGELEVISIPGYYGSSISREDKILTILLGFEGNLSSVIYEDVTPSELQVINGMPSYTQKFKDISIINNNKLISTAEIVRYSSANDPYKTFNELSLIRYQNEGKSLIVAPLGTKPMALGACFFALKYKDVRIIYPFPQKLSSSSNDQSTFCWTYKF